MHPINRVIDVERIPAELIGDLVKLSSIGIGVVGGRFPLLEWRMRCCRKDTVEPCLLILVARGRERGSGKFLGVESIRRLLRRIGTYRQGPFDRLRSKKSECGLFRLWRWHTHGKSRSHSDICISLER